jgi:hypothetical protein
MMPGGPGGMPGGSPDGGMGGPGRGGPGGMMPGGPGGMMPGGPGGMPGMPGGMGYRTQPDTDFLLMRFLDVDVRPGYTYQYRVRLRLKNPNYGKKPTEVGRPADARQPVIFNQASWRELPVQITLPQETHLYALDPQAYLKTFQDFYKDHGSEYALKRLAEVEQLEAGKRAVVQVQQWQPSVRIDGTTKQEPVGAWVVADLPVAPGEYLGKRTLVELPLWNAGLNNFILRELAGGVKVSGIKDANKQPKGWPINFRTPNVLADFDGGRQVQRVGDRVISDDAAQELLIVRPDGKLVVKNSADDGLDIERKDRSDVWAAWLKRVKERKFTAAAGPGGPGGQPGFGRP